MSIMELGALGEFVASFGVIATLIYLAVQMRQNTKAVRLNTAHAVTEELQDMFSLLVADEGMADVMLEAGQKRGLSGAVRVRYYTFTSNLMRGYENAFLQRQEDAISEAHWTGITRMMIDFTAMAAFPEYWADRKHWLSDDFQAYMDAEIISAAPQPGVNIPGNYRNAQEEGVAKG